MRMREAGEFGEYKILKSVEFHKNVNKKGKKKKTIGRMKAKTKAKNMNKQHLWPKEVKKKKKNRENNSVSCSIGNW